MSSDEEEEEPAGMERWLLTYADMITLLLALFVVLYALGSLNHVKYSEFAKGMNVSFNNGHSQPSSATTQASKTKGQPVASSSDRAPATPPAASRLVATVEQQLRGALIKAGLHQGRGAHQSVPVASSSGSSRARPITASTPPPSARSEPQVVDITGAVIRSHTNPVNVEGYTDNEPITGGPYRDNWQLSAERAVVVVERLQDVAHVNPAQLYIVGFGQYHPIVPNTSPVNQAKNRRRQHRDHDAGPEGHPAMTVVVAMTSTGPRPSTVSTSPRSTPRSTPSPATAR